MAEVERCFAELGEVELLPGRAINAASVRDADILLVRSVTPVDRALIDQSQLRFVGSATSGIDHVDRELLLSRAIPFAWAPGSNADSVVDYVLSAIANCDDKLERLLAGEALGLIGYGHIGRCLQQRLGALGIAVKAYDPWLSAQNYPALTDLSNVLDCEVVSIHAELTQRQPHPSLHLLNRETLSALRPGSLLVSAGRGEIVDTQALIAAQEVGHFQLVMDVWEGEPIVKAEVLDHCLFGTAHIAGYSTDGKLRATRMLYDACVESLAIDTETRPLSAPAGPIVTVNPDLDAAGIIRYLLGQVYDIAVDDQLLRQRAPSSFDDLRKSYRNRRELQLLTISNLEHLSESQQQLCGALGCVSDQVAPSC